MKYTNPAYQHSWLLHAKVVGPSYGTRVLIHLSKYLKQRFMNHASVSGGNTFNLRSEHEEEEEEEEQEDQSEN